MAAKNSQFVKRANVPVEYDRERAHELVKCARDVVYFVKNYVKITHPTRGIVPFELYTFQEDVLRMYASNRYCISMQSRQTGKSATACAYLLWLATFTDNATILIAAHKNSGAMEMIKRIRFMYEHLPDWLKPGINESYWNKHELGFDNGSMIFSEATSEDTGRGKSITALFADEFAFVNDTIANEFWAAISPTLATGGQCIITSTPNGDKNLFSQLWRGAENGVNGFAYTFVAWDEVPGRDEKFKEEQIAKLGKEKWEQEFLCLFISSDPTLMDTNILLNYKTKDPLQVATNGIKWFENIKLGGKYLMGVDPATGAGKDYSTFQLLEFPTLIQVAEFRSNVISSSNFYETIKYVLLVLEQKQCITYFSCENNGIGEAIITLYDMDESIPDNAEFISESGKNRNGFTTTKRIKTKCCILLKELFESGKMKLSSVDVINELKSYISKNNTYAAKHGSTDDLISALLIIIRILDEIAMYEEGVYDKIYKHDINADEFSLTNNPTDNEPSTYFVSGNSLSNYGAYGNVGTLSNPNDPYSWDPFGDIF